MVDSKQKGARAELIVRDKLRELTALNWERVPGSGGLHEKHGLKGDLYIPNKENIFCVEVKHYAEDHLSSSLLTSEKPTFIDWWKQTIRESSQVNKTPLLIFKFDRSKLFVAFEDMPTYDYKYIFLQFNPYEIYVATLNDWITKERPKFIK